MEVAPAGGDDEEDAADCDGEPADRLASTPAERRGGAEQQREAPDRSECLPDFGEPDSRVRLDAEREKCHARMIAAAPDGFEAVSTSRE